jgi:hypothetical protein
MQIDRQLGFELIKREKNLIESDIVLNKFNNNIFLKNIDNIKLENNIINNKLDDYIFEVFRRNERNEILSHHNQPANTNDIKEFFSSTTGFSVQSQCDTPYNLVVEGKPIWKLSGKISKIDFTPNHRVMFDPTEMTDSLVKGIQGLVELFKSIDQGKVGVAPLLFGTTNKHMALIAQRMGFKIVDSCRTEDGEINNKLESYTVVAKIEDVRQKITEFQKSATKQRLFKRQARLNSRPSPAY